MSILAFTSCPVQEKQKYVFDIRTGREVIKLNAYIVSIEEKDIFWYVTYIPVGESTGFCEFGTQRISKVGFETLFGIFNINKK